jgi:DNA-binding SARP family transcriptional activator
MSRMSIQLFGQFCIRRKEQLLGGFETHKVQELFYYILLHRHHSLSRESLASLLWANTTTAQSKKRLRQVLWHLHGDRAATLRQYEYCIAALDEELGVKPSKRKVALYKQILTEQLTEPQSALPPIEAHRALEVSASPQMEMLGP